MINAKAVIAAICASYDGSPEQLPEFIGEEYQDVLALGSKLRGIGNQRNIALQECDERCDALAEEERGLQQGCAHWTTTFYPDASGGSDSSTQCDICGAEL